MMFLLRDIFSGKEPADEYYIPSDFRIGESCGCDKVHESDVLRRSICRNSPRNAVYAEFRAGRIHFMENAVLKSERYSTLGENLREFFYASDGHEMGDVYIRNSCALICDFYKRSTVFRMGGDEFMAIMQGRDYKNREELLEKFRRASDESLDAAIKRADEEMYQNKRKMKNR